MTEHDGTPSLPTSPWMFFENNRYYDVITSSPWHHQYESSNISKPLKKTDPSNVCVSIWRGTCIACWKASSPTSLPCHLSIAGLDSNLLPPHCPSPTTGPTTPGRGCSTVLPPARQLCHPKIFQVWIYRMIDGVNLILVIIRIWKIHPKVCHKIHIAALHSTFNLTFGYYLRSQQIITDQRVCAVCSLNLQKGTQYTTSFRKGNASVECVDQLTSWSSNPVKKRFLR